MSSQSRLTRAYIDLDRLGHNLRLLQRAAGGAAVWPVVKANAYGHDAALVTAHLESLGIDTLGVADVAEAIVLREAGVRAKLVVLSPTLPEHVEALVEHGCEPVVCSMEMPAALAREASRRGTEVAIHLKVDTGMGRVGIAAREAATFLEHCRGLEGLRVRGLMSHFPCADEADKSASLAQLERFRQLAEACAGFDIAVRHTANSAAILDLPGSHFDAVRPGIALYGLPPSRDIANPVVRQLQPILHWETRITFLKDVPAGTGLSYGHVFHTRRDSLIATVPVGYGDGLSRNLSNRCEMLVQGRRCPQVGRVTMDMSLIDVSALRGEVAPGDPVVIIGCQGSEEISADELANTLGTINYEIVTRIAQRVPRIAMSRPEPTA